MSTLVSCECISELPQPDKIDAIYCALAEIAAAGGGTGGTPISDLPVATEMQPDDVAVGNVADVTSQIPKNVMTTLRTDLAANNTWDGIALSGNVAGEDLAFFDCVKMGGAGWAMTDAEIGGIFPAVGIVTVAALTNAVPTVMVLGVVRKNAHGFTGAVYLSTGTPGAITSTAPSGTGQCVQKVGTVLDANHIYFNFNGEYLTLT